MWQKRWGLQHNHNWLLHHDIAPAHTFLKTTESVTSNSMVIVPHPPNLPDLAPYDFALFSKLKIKLKGRCFETVSDIQRELEAVLDNIKETDFPGSVEVWKK
jgi:transposase